MFGSKAAYEKCQELEGEEFLGRRIHLSAEKPQPREAGCAVYIRGFDDTWDKEDIFVALREAFGAYGRVRIRIPTDRDTMAVKGFAFAEFNDAASRVNHIHCHSFLDSCIVHLVY